MNSRHTIGMPSKPWKRWRNGRKWPFWAMTTSTFSAITRRKTWWPFRSSTCEAAGLGEKGEFFGEQQEILEAGEFFQSVLKQYSLDAPFFPVELRLPADFEDRTL